MTDNEFLQQVGVRTKIQLTDEQVEVCKNFHESMVLFASPGTGKTATAVMGLLTAELLRKIPGDQIRVMSFTNAATNEIARRHRLSCKRLGITQRPVFQTLHSICTTLLREHYKLLGMPACSICTIPLETQVSYIQEYAKMFNMNVPLEKTGNIIRAANRLNASLTFDPIAVQNSYAFKRLHIDFDVFSTVRYLLYNYGRLLGKVPVSEILLYTLNLLIKHPEIAEDFKQRCKLMIVDEAQDMSVLQLLIISKLCDNIVLIGDMKQQIYAFNGASPEVVLQFQKLRPHAKTLALTQSFRCKNEIADFATKLITPNALGGEDLSFHGNGDGGSVEIVHDLNVETLVNGVAQNYLDANHILTEDIMFLYRDNVTAIPLVETLYRDHLPYRISSYTKAYEVPVVKDLIDLAQLAANPHNSSYLGALALLLPELGSPYMLQNNPLYKIMQKLPDDVPYWNINYRYKDAEAATDINNTLLEVSDMIAHGSEVSDICNTLLPIYRKYYLQSHMWKFEQEPMYYIKHVTAAMKGKTLERFINEETAKVELSEEYTAKGIGIRCYTMHASKGLEADTVYILDANEGIIPNASAIRRELEAHCDIDVAKAIRNERSLCYVACTRARKKLVISYTGELAILLDPERHDGYARLDRLYESSMSGDAGIDAFHEWVKEGEESFEARCKGTYNEQTTGDIDSTYIG